MDVAADEAGIELKEFQPGQEVHFPEGLQNKQFTIANAVLESDGIVSLPKLKAHGMQKFTGCVKNQFGCIPGLLKGEFHVRIPDAYLFAQMLVDLDRLRPPPALHHGRDRRHGRQRPPRRHAEKDERAAVFGRPHRGRCDRLPPDRPRSAARADHRVRPGGRSRHPRAGKHRAARRRLRFIPVSRFCHRSHARSNPTGKRAPCDSVSNRLVPKPVIAREKCIRCGLCIAVCPAKPKAVDWRNGDTSQPPVHDYRTCIRCYCCQELCPEKAIELRKPLLRRVFSF